MNSVYILLMTTMCYLQIDAQNTNNVSSNQPSIACGNLVFSVPPGWKLEPSGENYALMLPPRNNDPQRWINIAVFKGSVSSGNIETDFNNAWQTFLGKYTKYQEPFLLKEKSIKGYDIIRGGTNIRKGNDMPLYAHLWVAKVKDKVETVIVFANNSNDFDISVNTELKPFWAKLQFKNLPEETTGNYTLKGNGIQGIYTGLQSGMLLSGGIAKNMSFLIIYNDGKLKRANRLPEKGFTDFDREVDRETNAGNWGEYDIKKGTVVFDKNGQSRAMGFAYQPPRVIYNEYVFTKMPAVDGLCLSGTYTADNSKTAVDAFGHEPTISFYTNGRFEDNTALYFVSTDSLFKNPGRGKYAINNFTIDLLYDDGRGGVSFSFVSFDKTYNRSIQIGQHVMVKK